MAHLVQHREQGEDLVGNALHFRYLHPRLDVLLHRQAWEDHAALRHIGDATGHALEAFLAGNFLAVDFDGTIGRGQDADERLEQVVLPMPLRPMMARVSFLGLMSTPWMTSLWP
jgi:hypothetical protein